ncbi:hypothetical protein ACGF5C_32195 [Micromonospora sp. NPDC047620]|uniref:hypothetical protein n=1 Tax=Micromonospora sp. NPDC047620 TaxID=3364251 RepID=UPI003715B200
MSQMTPAMITASQPALAKRRDIDRELDVLRALRRDVTDTPRVSNPGIEDSINVSGQYDQVAQFLAGHGRGDEFLGPGKSHQRIDQNRRNAWLNY